MTTGNFAAGQDAGEQEQRGGQRAADDQQHLGVLIIRLFRLVARVQQFLLLGGKLLQDVNGAVGDDPPSPVCSMCSTASAPCCL